MIWLVFVATLSFASAEFLDLDDSIRIFCKICGENITTMDHLVNVKSTEAVSRRNETTTGGHGILIQEFINPNNIPFEVMTVTDADVLPVGQRVATASFFPGYDWTIVVCPKCKRHIGWAFTENSAPENSEPTFYALIMDKLFYEMDGQTVVQRSWNS